MITLTQADLDAWSRLVPRRATLPMALRRIVLHWSGGAHKPNSVDRAAYHFLVTGPDGWVERGDHPLEANLRTPLAGGPYAAHTGGLNTASAGVSWCGMRDSDVERGKMGPSPITEAQLHRGLAFVAYLALEMGLDPSNSGHVHTHREAWEIHGVKGTTNHTKPDFIILPPYPTVTGWRACGEWMRRTAALYAGQIRTLRSDPGATVRPLRTWVIVTSDSLHLRRTPGTGEMPAGVALRGQRVIVDGVTEGQVVSGNGVWYRTPEGHWVWAGGTDTPRAA